MIANCIATEHVEIVNGAMVSNRRIANDRIIDSFRQWKVSIMDGKGFDYTNTDFTEESIVADKISIDGARYLYGTPIFSIIAHLLKLGDFGRCQ